jgi:lipopolysaccharide biosynthesis regulator YciM
MLSIQRPLAHIVVLLSCFAAAKVLATPTAWPEFAWAAQQAALSPNVVAPEQLPQQITKLIKQGKTLQAQAELAAALPTLLLNPQSSSFTAVQPWLFAWDWISPVRAAAQNALAAKQWDNAYYLACVLADYYLQDMDLKNAREALEQASFADAKSAAGEYASLLQGILLQKQKKHREAAKLYEKIPPSSALYLNAQLNLATANIRQDWWADAITFIHNARNKQGKQQTELANHLLMTLGFIQLKAGFYRDAAASFRQITQDSRYAKRAALGLGLGFLEQKKYPEAANIFNHLKAATPSDISTADGYFLAAVTAQNRNASAEAITLYKNAISWYETQLLQLAHVKNLSLNLSNPQALTALKSAWETLPIRSVRTQKLLARQQEFCRLQTQAPAAFKSTTTALQTELERELSESLAQSLEENNQALNAYLSNCRYGLANTYDKKS